MSYILTNEGIIGIASQTAKGSANTTPDIYAKFVEGAFPEEMEVTHLRESGDDELIGTSIKNSHMVKFSFKVLARPQITAYLFAYLLGKDTTSGGSDPYTHTIIRSATNGRAWLTIRRKVTTNVTQQLTDAKIEKITIEGEAGKEMYLNVEGNAITTAIVAAEDTASYESGKPFTFYHSNGNFEIESGLATDDIKSYSIGVTVKSQEGMLTDDYKIADLPDLQLDIDFSAVLFAESETFWKKANYNNTTAMSEDLYTSQFTADHTYTESVADDREFKIVLKDIVWQPVVLDPKSEPAVQEHTIAGIVRKPSAGEIVTITVKNDIATHIYDS